MKRVRSLRAVTRIVALIFSLSLGMGEALSNPIEVQVSPVKRDRDDQGPFPAALEFLGGFELKSADPHFGGLSGMVMHPDGATLTFVSDHGYWFSTQVLPSVRGSPVKLGPWRKNSLLAPNGKAVRGRLRDAEAVTRDHDGSFIVAFERVHRLWRYPPTPLTFTARPKPIPIPDELARAPSNGGIEAATVLPDRRILLLSENFQNEDGSLKGWLLQGKRTEPLFYLSSDGFNPTDLATLPNGDVLVLERRYTWIRGASARLRWLPRASLKPGARLRGKEIASLGPAVDVDNLEGLAVHQDPREGTVLYIVSDDNYSLFQRTLLLQFRLNRLTP